MELLTTLITILTCLNIGLFGCGALNIWYNIVRYHKVNNEYFIAVFMLLVSIGCNALLLFVLANIKGI